METEKSPALATSPGAEVAAVVSENTPTETTPSANKAFREFEENLRKVDIPKARTDLITAYTNYTSKRLSRWKNKCLLQKADETFRFYQALSDNIGVFARKDAAMIKEKIDKAIDPGSKNVGEKLTASFAALKEAKAKLNEVRIKGEDLVQKLSDSNYSDPLAELIRSFKDSTPFYKKDDEKNFKDTIEGLKKESKDCFDLADDAVEVAVKIAGINANASIKSLKDPGAEMAAKVDQLQTDIQANIDSAKSKQSTAQTNYVAIMNELAAAKYAKYGQSLLLGGLWQTASQVHSPDCKTWSHNVMAAQLDSYADKVEKNFEKLINYNYPETPTV